MLRPEQFSIGNASPSHRGALEVNVDQIVFTGSSYELLGKTQKGRNVVAVIPATHQGMIAEIETTKHARLTYDPAAVHLIHQRGPQS